MRPIPILLVGSMFWKGLADWLKTTMVGEKMIDAQDLELFKVVDKPEDVVNAIFEYYGSRGFEPSAQERETLLEL